MNAKEKIIENAHESFTNLLMSRIEIALFNLADNPEYKEICKDIKRCEDNLDFLLQKTNDFDQFIMKHYTESLSIKFDIESKEIYIQGVRDCLHFMKFLNFNCQDF